MVLKNKFFSQKVNRTIERKDSSNSSHSCSYTFKDQECVASSCFHDSSLNLLPLDGSLVCHSVPPE